MSAPLKLQNPNDRRPPSERNLTIYTLCKAHRVPQKDLALKYEIGAPRVSQIVKEVGDWFANASAKDGELDHNQQRRLERRIERERLEHLYGKSLRMLEDFEKPAESTRGEGEGAVKTTREERNARVQALKSCTRIAESLGKIAEREPLPEPAGVEVPIPPYRLYGELKRQREAAEGRGATPVSGNSHEVVSYLLGALRGDKLWAIPAGGPLQAAMRKIVETLVEAGAVGPVGWDQAAAAAGPPEAGPEPGGPARAAPAGPTLPPTDAGAKVTKLTCYSLLDGCDPEILQRIVANDWLERFKDGGEMHRESLVAASLAREKSGEFSAEAAGSKAQSPRSKVAEAGSDVAATTQSVAGERGRGSIAATALADGQRSSQLTPDPLQAAPAKRPAPPRGIDVVGSPEWKVARAKWLKERDERVERERLQKIQERIEREAEQRRAAADARRRWLEAGRCRY